jgi:hypothetical protein
MAETYDLIAINERGVYAICSDEAGADYVEEFRRDVLAAGHVLARAPTREACERHRAYLATLPEFAALLDPSPPSSTTLSEGATP